MEAGEFPKNQALNKSIPMKHGKDRTDRYGRILAYAFSGNENVNLKLIKEGLAGYYFPSGKDKHYDEFVTAWKECVEEQINLCEKSEKSRSECIELKEFNPQTETPIFYNKCGFSRSLENWTIKDEGRKKFTFGNFTLDGQNQIRIVTEKAVTRREKNTLYREGESYVWTRSGDTLFLRDDDGKLVLWRNH